MTKLDKAMFIVQRLWNLDRLPNAGMAGAWKDVKAIARLTSERVEDLYQTALKTKEAEK